MSPSPMSCPATPSMPRLIDLVTDDKEDNDKEEYDNEAPAGPAEVRE